MEARTASLHTGPSRLDVNRAGMSVIVPIYVAYWFVPWVFVLRGNPSVGLFAGYGLLMFSMICCTFSFAPLLHALLCISDTSSTRTPSSPWPRRLRLLAGIGVLSGVAYLIAIGATSPAESLQPIWHYAAGIVAITSALTLHVCHKVRVLSIALAAAAGLLVVGSLEGAAAGLLAALISILVMQSSVRQLIILSELQHARLRERIWGIQEERLRVSRDLHDLAGHTLAAIALRSEAALALAERDQVEAWDQLRLVKDLASKASREMRGLSHGYRRADFASELRAAESLLHSAGVSVSITNDTEDVPPAVTETIAWVLREGVTNVLRHSRATEVIIDISPSQIRLVNDGVTASSFEDGVGLIGLRERVNDLNGELHVHIDNGTFSLIADFSPKKR